ncbi:MAG TPA: NIPSNAP family protein [Burkholderiales bacterium]|jgi:hypothetical protein
MIYEMRTYDLKSRTQAEVVKRFGEAYEKRKELSPLAAFFTTEIGPLNQIIHIWPYKDFEERTRVREESVAKGIWPPKISEFIVNMRSEIFIPFPFSPAFPQGDHGPFFEMRTYTYHAGDLKKIQADWEAAIPFRQTLSPVAAMWYSELGGLNKFVHLWPYKTLNDRVETRNKAVASGKWPPASKDPATGQPRYVMQAQENKILTAAPFSPLR